MIICICRRINEHGVREAVEAGARCPDSVQAYHGTAFNCGRCRTSIGDVISEEMDKRHTMLSVQVAAE